MLYNCNSGKELSLVQQLINTLIGPFSGM